MNSEDTAIVGTNGMLEGEREDESKNKLVRGDGARRLNPPTSLPLPPAVYAHAGRINAGRLSSR